ncbi:MAG: tRNA (cytidine(34)-2'-O)-methyltransferase [Verrucomicrobiota bacterium]|jgi:tRNA (cytidine/uridine-2'-O-)-methyltransferase|nr:tRNA (cytidine(34)-2'-O)-methyltransferase [Verrucomicrobiota bacterium]
MSRQGGGLNVVLVEPEIPPNTGNIARLCAATRTRLHLIEPLGFRLDDRRLRRAGVDYWQHLEWQSWPDWVAFAASVPAEAGLWFIESGGPTRYVDARFAIGDYLVFGRETVGLPESLCRAEGERWLRIPMFHEQVRSLNLANCVALVLYEAVRQLGYDGEL